MSDPATIHLRPSAPIARDALLPGDPGRALLLAQRLLDQPRMSNHHRGLWGYYGKTANGSPLTIQSTGMGGPSAAIVLEELAQLGLRRAIRVGTCGALDDRLDLGRMVVADAALSADGTSGALGASGRVEADLELSERLAQSAPEATRGLVASSDLFYDDDAARGQAWIDAGAVAVEMEAAALFAVGRRAGVAVACLLTVSDVGAGSGRVRIADEALTVASERMGEAAAAALDG